MNGSSPQYLKAIDVIERNKLWEEKRTEMEDEGKRRRKSFIALPSYFRWKEKTLTPLP